MDKKCLRKELIIQRKHLDKDYRLKADQKIFENLVELDAYRLAETIFCFVSTEDEVNTFPIIEHALNSGKQVAVPKCMEKGIMQAYLIRSFKDLESGKYGILEPASTCPLIEPENIDFSVVPCLSCNSDGYRIGYGGGFYDRYLTKVSGTSAAICYKKMMMEEIPVEKYDVKADMVISD